MVASSLQEYRLVVSHLGVGIPASLLLKKIASVDHFYHLTAALDGLRFPRLRSDIQFEEAREVDFSDILQGIRSLDAPSRKEVIARLRFRRRGFSSCTIGRNDKNDVVSMQWLIRPRDNAVLEKHFRRIYYHPLKGNEVMIENVFIFPAFRGLGVFPAVNYAVLNRAKEEGFRTCHTYIRKDNITSLNAYIDLGFRIRKLLSAYSLAGISWRTL